MNPEQPYYFNHTTQSAVPENIGDIVEKFYADAKIRFTAQPFTQVHHNTVVVNREKDRKKRNAMAKLVIPVYLKRNCHIISPRHQ